MLEAVKSAAKVAPSNPPVDVLKGILVESNGDTGEVYLTATNYEVSIQQKVMASVEESGTMLVDSRLLVGMMSLLEGEFVALSADRPELLTVTDGKCTYQINCLPPNSYPKPIMPFPEESAIMTGICSLAKRTTFAVSKDESKPALQCVNIKLKNNAVHAEACDGMRLMLTKDSAEPTDEREFLLPGRSFQVLASISSDTDVFEVGDIGKDVVFVRGDMMFTIRKLVTGGYMDTNAVIKSVKPLYTAVADVSQMKEALDLISVSALAGRTKEPINLVLSGNEIILKCSSDYAESITTVNANISQDTPDTGFFYDISALMKLFQVVKGKVKLEFDAKGFVLIKTRSEAYFQAPMRPPFKKAKPVKDDADTNDTKDTDVSKSTKDAENTNAA
jgi:DNA polymerase-3 subunit beta